MFALCLIFLLRVYATKAVDVDIDIDGGWSSWSPVKCGVTCGPGVGTSTRTCDNPEPKGNGTLCEGSNIRHEFCQGTMCPVNGSWTDWVQTTCNVECGTGIGNFTRSCTNPPPKYGGLECEGNATESRICNGTQCPVDGNWGEWLSDKGCTSVSCGIGVAVFTRSCDNPFPAYLGKECPGRRHKTEYCYQKACPINGQWSSWQTGECSVTCGGGIIRTIRHCDNPAPQNGGNACVGDHEIEEKCNEETCSISFICTKTWISHNNKCYLDVNKQSNSLNAETHCVFDKDSAILPELKNEKDIDFYKTPGLLNFPKENYWLGAYHDGRDYVWVTKGKLSDGKTNWAVDYPTDNGDAVVITPNGTWMDVNGRQRENVVCQKDAIEINWSSFSNCSGTCGGGSGTQTRTPLTCKPENACDGIKETRDCINMVPCAINGAWSSWVQESCSLTCGVGPGVYRRICTNPKPEHNGRYCVGEDRKTDDCHLTPCPVDGGWSSWTFKNGIQCSVTCGQGIQLLTRRCNRPYPAYGGAKCPGEDSKHDYCNLKMCTTVIQQRVDSSLDFFHKTWVEYENGFGDVNNNFWIGLNKLYEMTKDKPLRIRFEMKRFTSFSSGRDVDGRLYYAEYSSFGISGPEDNYRLHISGYTGGNAGDAMNYYGSNGQVFSTHDRRNGNSCSSIYGGWWRHTSNNCHHVQPNGYYHNYRTSSSNGILWYSLDNHHSLAYFRILLMPRLTH